MAPKKAAGRPVPARSSKRPIKGPSQALRSPQPGQSLKRIQAMVSSLSGDPVTLARVEAEMDGLLHRCSTPSTSSAFPPPPVDVSSPASSSSEEGEPLLAGVGLPDAPQVQPSVLPVSQDAVPRGRGRARVGARRSASTRGRAVRGSPVRPPALGHSNPVHSQVVSVQSAPGAVQQGEASDSSIEDSLPLPPRSSSGGHRRRKRGSRRHSKKRRRDTSSSTSGTSSISSSSDEGAPLKLYWGYGESSGLPKWVWERRANSHRARYGAVQECREGVLVPDVRVSTNSARDIIPGAHLSSKLRSRILDGRYVDIFSLAPPLDGQEPLDKGLSVPKRRTIVAKADRTFERWMDSFQVFAGVISAAYPKRSLHLWVYLSIVRSAFTMAGETAALSYDQNFRRRAAKIPTARWDRKDLDVWTTYVAPRIEKKASELQKFKPATQKVGRKWFCWDFNKGICQRQACKFAHLCDKCSGSHSASACSAARRPFRRGGGSQQPPKVPAQPPVPGAGK